VQLKYALQYTDELEVYMNMVIGYFWMTGKFYLGADGQPVTRLVRA
jgi:hypothetical protein